MPADRRELAAVFAGGFAGTVARARIADALPQSAGHWPWATFIANICGAFVLGWVATRLHGGGPAARLRLRLLGTGFCGALTTFSTLQLEVLRMLDDGDGALAAAYVFTSVAGGLGVVALATTWARRARALP